MCTMLEALFVWVVLLTSFLASRKHYKKEEKGRILYLAVLGITGGFALLLALDINLFAIISTLNKTFGSFSKVVVGL
jgi:hypothetical protein